MPDGNSFLPRLRSVFYARFDEFKGPEIAYQVPEGLIATSGAVSISGAASPAPSGSSRASSIVFVPPDNLKSSESRVKASPHKNPPSSSRTLLNFDDISKYIIAQSPLCGRLVTCTAGKYKVLGFPIELSGHYERYYFRFNICFVFDASADLSCYEPIVRKVNRVLTACEVSLFLCLSRMRGIYSETLRKSRRFCRLPRRPSKYMLSWSSFMKI
jgi:nitrogen permease regulator 2-like protein